MRHMQICHPTDRIIQQHTEAATEQGVGQRWVSLLEHREIVRTGKDHVPQCLRIFRRRSTSCGSRETGHLRRTGSRNLNLTEVNHGSTWNHSFRYFTEKNQHQQQRLHTYIDQTAMPSIILHYYTACYLIGAVCLWLGVFMCYQDNLLPLRVNE